MNTSKWITLGVGIAAVIAVIISSIHMYSAAVARSTIEKTLASMAIVGMAPIQRLEDPARFSYQLDLKVSNPDRMTASVELLSWQVKIEETVFTAVKLNSWKAVIHPQNSRDQAFSPRGQITIFEPTIVDLKEKDIVPLIVTGEISVIASQAWVSQTVVYEFRLESSVLFN